MSCDCCPGVEAVHHLCDACVQEDIAREDLLRRRADAAESEADDLRTLASRLNAEADELHKKLEARDAIRSRECATLIASRLAGEEFLAGESYDEATVDVVHEVLRAWPKMPYEAAEEEDGE